MISQFHWTQVIPGFRRLMIFVDGENLVLRYQDMIKKGCVPREDNVTHIPDVLIWHPTFSQLVAMDEVLRASYYTYVVGDENKVEEVRNIIKELTFNCHQNSTLPRNLTPRVFKKSKKTARAKGVDISLTVDILTQVHNNNIDTVLLLAGDGDYIPVVNEIHHCGKQCYISAFSDGLNQDLKLMADKFYWLDSTMFVRK